MILHGYGHGIQRNINTGWTGGDTSAMGEGFGDYWAGSYSYSTPNGPTYHPEWVFSWDGHSNCWGGRALNRTDARYNRSRTYGAHQSVSEGGVTFVSDELWSSPLFQALTSLMANGKSRAVGLFHVLRLLPQRLPGPSGPQVPPHQHGLEEQPDEPLGIRIEADPQRQLWEISEKLTGVAFSV